MPDEPRPEKVAVVEEVRERLTGSAAAIMTEYRGLKVQDMAALRRALTAAGGEYKVYKNTLVRRAAQDTGLAELEPMLEGPTAIAFVRGDVAAVAKVLRDFARTSPNLVVKGGLVGRSVFDARGAAQLADLPSREVLLSQIAGAFAAPMQKFAALLKALPQNFAYGLSALVDQRRAAEGESTAAGGAADERAASPAEETAGEADASPADATSTPLEASAADEDPGADAEAQDGEGSSSEGAEE